MKRLKQTIAVLAVVLSPFASFVSAPVVLAATCENGYTGPDSNNLCISTTTYRCEVTSVNEVTIINDNTQVSLSGNAGSQGNTESGSVQTGTATNTNGVTFNVVVTNPTVDEELCVVTATVPATPTPIPAEPVAPAGQGAVAVVTAPKTVTPRTLAQTSGDETAKYVVSSVAALAAAFGLSRAVVFAYGRYKA